MRIAMVGATAEGKTRFLNVVLVPALLRHPEYDYRVYEHGILTALSGGNKNPFVTVGAFTDANAACTWLKVQRP